MAKKSHGESWPVNDPHNFERIDELQRENEELKRDAWAHGRKIQETTGKCPVCGDLIQC